MTRIFHLCIVSIAFYIQASAGIFCPPAITVNCDTDVSQTSITGVPTLLGTHSLYHARYTDALFTNQCHIGYIDRKWYVDIDGDATFDDTEPSCIHRITQADIDYPINIVWPTDVTVSCIDAVPTDQPYWQGGPCDAIGYHVNDMTFTAAPDACFKIMRTHTLTNWCDHALFTHTQVIKVKDEQGPTLSPCQDQTFGLDGNCQATVSLTKSAADVGTCPNTTLLWKVDVDLWADGTVDYEYGPDKSGKLKISNTTNHQEVKIEIPEALGRGIHTVKWNVRDACGNWKSCIEKFYTKDLKPPTPYCEQVIWAAFDGSMGMSVPIRARKFNVNSVDNCTPQHLLKYSFSTDVNDTLIMIDCFSQGFQFFNLYVTDQEGNSDFCNTYMLIFDNNNCGFRVAAASSLSYIDGTPMNDAMLYAYADGQLLGAATYDSQGRTTIDVPSNERLTFTPSKLSFEEEAVDIEDFILLKDHLIGKTKIGGVQTIAADINNDKKINPADLRQLAQHLLNQDNELSKSPWAFVLRAALSNTDLTNYEAAVSIKKYDGNLPFVGLLRGDLNNSHLSAIEGRSQRAVICHTTANTDGTYSLYSSEDITIQGLQMKLTSPQEALITHTAADAMYHRAKDVFNYIITSPISITTQLPMLTMSQDLSQLGGKAVLEDGEVVSLQFAASTENSRANDWIVYPNPASQYIQIEGNEAIGQIDIMDPLGRVLVSAERTSIVDLPQGYHGVCSVVITTLKGTKVVKKVIVMP